MSELEAAIIGGLVGGILGVIGTLVSSYYGQENLRNGKTSV